MCWLLTILPNIYGGRSVWSKANDDMAFATVSDTNEEPKMAIGKRDYMFQMQEIQAL